MLKDPIINNAFIDDKLGRKEVAEHFKNILLNTDLNVFSLVAPWGCGKTYFIQNLIKIMEDDSVNILYNAWESDFYDSPLIPLLVELLAKIEIYNKKDKLTEDINWSKNFAKKICKGATFHAGINLGAINCSANFDPNIKMLDSEYMQLKAEIKTFRDKLQNIQKTLKKKIIIFIDELDRCHPMYTIKTLEIIKHFFGIDNVVFVLAIDKLQIENSVRTIYGVNKGQENGYLRKFIDVEFQLPEPNAVMLINFHLQKIWDKIYSYVGNNRYYNCNLQRKIDPFGIPRDIDVEQEKECISLLITKIVSFLKFSLRDIEKYFIRLDILLSSLSLSTDILFIEPLLVFNALLLLNEDEFNSYATLENPSDRVKLLCKNIIPHWTGFFVNAYKDKLNNYLRSDHIDKLSPEDNADGVNKILKAKISINPDEQELYLKNYPLKIKFINNFNQLTLDN